ncbi:MAG: sodium/proline symporter [Candidatus Eisenbacteria bacterium]|uniref:Sodium/proline symporter n=1 Tax=Eiseniibacteriota bacterium TaxID=2212470 RepID=A0A948WD09_UNCEI|nr:sodium/proline symporter [Candidatus Eisenbacteria bacterium]MBU1950200.1 sodium/proline symporter [Candidatus Eisenbacteria bacterium]MBU2691403.1 sodium/proline symporter [Candidatus Eisenbacteria bacterium]
MTPVAIGFVVYLLLIFVVGILSARKTKTLPDFLLAGRRLGPWVVAFSERASGESGWMLLGLTGLAYASGLGDPSGRKLEPAFWTAVGGVCGIAASWLLIASRLRRESERLGALTLPRFFELKFGTNDPMIRLVATGIISFCFAFYIGAQFDAAGKSLQQTFGWSHLSGVFVGAAIIVFYTLMGGFFAVAWTDFIQGWIMLFTLVALPLATFIGLGGWDGCAAKITAMEPQFLTLSGGRSGWRLLSGILGGFGVGMGYLGQPHLLVRYMSLRSHKSVPKARTIALTWAILAYGGAVMMGLVALAYYGGGAFDDPEKMMPALAMDVFPAWLAGILICGALAAMMSTADSQLLVTTSAVAEDIYHQSIRPKASQKHLVQVSRFITLIVGIVAIALSQLPRSIFDKVLFAWGGLGAAFGPALLLSLWWKGTTRNGVLAGMVVGFVSVILWDNSLLSSQLYSLVPAFVLSFLAVLFFSRLTRK